MSNVYPSVAVEAKLDGSNWTNITEDVIFPIHFEGGIMGNGPEERVAETGEMSFEMDNSHRNSGGVVGYYTPGAPQCRSGFSVGLIVRLRITFDGLTKTKFYGRIPQEGIAITPNVNGPRRVSVSVRDFMEQTAIHEMITPDFAQDKKVGEVSQLILNNMVVSPVATDLRTGQDTFSNVFDTVRSKTVAMSEISKTIISELGYAYVTHTIDDDEVLRVEGRYTRNDERTTPTEYPMCTDNSGHLLTEDGVCLLAENGDYLIINELTTFSSDNEQIDMGVTHGKHFYNRVKFTSYPRKVDASPVVLATLQQPVYIAAGDTITVTLRYRDPTGGTSNVSGVNMVTPAAGTDYNGNTLANGTGTDITASLQVTATFGTGDAVYAIKNNSGSNGYILAGAQARGYGVYIYDPVDAIAEDNASILANGPFQLEIDQKYQDSPLNSISFAATYLELYNVQRMVVDWARFCANKSARLMMAFMFLEPGDRVSLVEDVSAINGDFFIQGVQADILPGGVIYFDWYVKDAGYDVFSVITLDTSTLDGSDVLGF